jgi:recombination protein RecR
LGVITPIIGSGTGSSGFCYHEQIMEDRSKDIRADEARPGAGTGPGGVAADAPAGGPQGATRPAGPAAKVRPAFEPVRRHVYPGAVERLIGEFARLPGIGRRTAERLAFHILKSDAPTALALAKAVQDVKETVRHCGVCYNLTDADPCPICADPGRDRSLVLVVEQPKDLIALEQTGMYRGVYHVLMGHISPLEGIGPDDLTVNSLFERVDRPERNPGAAPVREVVLGLNPTLEGDGTALYLADQLKGRGLRVSRLARGLPTGGQLEYANKAVLADAIQGRQAVD